VTAIDAASSTVFRHDNITHYAVKHVLAGPYDSNAKRVPRWCYQRRAHEPRRADDVDGRPSSTKEKDESDCRCCQDRNAQSRGRCSPIVADVKASPGRTV
jgi:hypothetical protein